MIDCDDDVNVARGNTCVVICCGERFFVCVFVCLFVGWWIMLGACCGEGISTNLFRIDTHAYARF